MQPWGYGAHVAPSTGRPATVIAVGGGKGGIGKSLVAANLGVHLAQQGQRVVLVDADLGGANLHTCLGMAPPKHTLSDFVERRVGRFSDVVSATGIERLGLVSGALDQLDAANPKHAQKQRLLRSITHLQVDTVIIDLGGGTGFNTLDFFLTANRGVLTVMPEPTSVENVYRFIKAAYYRRLRAMGTSWNLRPLVERATSESGDHGLRSPAELLQEIEKINPWAAMRVRDEMSRSTLELVVNQARSAQEERLGHAISAACRRYFGVALRFLGAIPYDDAVWKAVRARRPLMIASPSSRASEAIRRIAAALLECEGR